jgi:hypothetical protein
VLYNAFSLDWQRKIRFHFPPISITFCIQRGEQLIVRSNLGPWLAARMQQWFGDVFTHARIFLSEMTVLAEMTDLNYKYI